MSFGQEYGLDIDDIENNDTDILFNLSTEHVEHIHNTIKTTDLLELYGLYKQATVGKCNIQKPTIFNIHARAKWSAWHDLDSMSFEKAKKEYFAKVCNLDTTWYENLKCSQTSQFSPQKWIVHSVEMPPNIEEKRCDDDKTIFDFVREGNIKRVKSLLKNTDLSILDENGMAIIHWAADSNNIEMLEYILSVGCPVDLRDATQQTALHYAASCSHMECVRLLLKNGAKPTNVDAEGQTCWQVADDTMIRSLLTS